MISGILAVFLIYKRKAEQLNKIFLARHDNTLNKVNLALLRYTFGCVIIFLC